MVPSDKKIILSRNDVILKYYFYIFVIFFYYFLLKAVSNRDIIDNVRREEMLGNKKKISIDLEPDVLKIYTNEMEKQNKSGTRLINDTLWSLYCLPDDVRAELGEFCWDRYTQNMLQAAKDQSYAGESCRATAQHWRALGELLGDNDKSKFGKVFGEKHMRQVLLADGYCIFPDDWICLDNVFGVPADQCRSVYVVESRNSAKFGIPHFVVFAPFDPEPDYMVNPSLTETQIAMIYKKCEEVYPDFRKFFNMQVTLSREENQDMEKLKIWDQAPYFAVFTMPDYNNPRFIDPFSKRFCPPDGSMIVRYPKTEE